MSEILRQLQSGVFGSGVYTERQYSAANGYLTGIKIGLYATHQPLKRAPFHYNERGDMVFNSSPAPLGSYSPPTLF